MMQALFTFLQNYLA